MAQPMPTKMMVRPASWSFLRCRRPLFIPTSTAGTDEDPLVVPAVDVVFGAGTARRPRHAAQAAARIVLQRSLAIGDHATCLVVDEGSIPVVRQLIGARAASA